MTRRDERRGEKTMRRGGDRSGEEKREDDDEKRREEGKGENGELTLEELVDNGKECTHRYAHR